MQRWRYMILHYGGPRDGRLIYHVDGNPLETVAELPEVLNQFGGRGWEMVSSSVREADQEASYIFKKPTD